MASVHLGESVFFHLFQTHCSDSDLGHISVNWFEELTAEAAHSQLILCEDEGTRVDGQFDNCFKTPNQKQPNYSQLDSTPTIFKEQSLRSPLFLSPTKDHCKNNVVLENRKNVHKPERCSGDTTQLLPKEVFGSSSRCLGDSPVVMKEMFKTPFWDQKYIHRTPQRDRKTEICDSLFCTPKLIRNQTPRCISESLGAEADPDMSWSSSLATPPSPTVIIAQANDEAPKMRIFDKKDAVIVQSLFSKLNNAVETVSLAQPSDTKVDKGIHAKIFDSTAADKTGNCAIKATDSLKPQQQKTVLNAVKNKEPCQEVGNRIEGMEDVLSIFFSEKPSGRRKVKIDSRIKRKNRTELSALEKNASVFEYTGEQNALLSSENLLRFENHKYSSCRQGYEQDVHQKTSSSYEWSPLNLPDLNTTQEESLPIEIVSYGAENKMENATCSDSRQQRNDGTLEVSCVPTETCGSNIHNQERCLLTTFHNKPHEKVSEVNLACGDASDIHIVDGLNSVDQSFVSRPSSIAGNGNDLWKCGHLANQKAKTTLSTLKRQTKFVYSLHNEMSCHDRGCAKDVDGLSFREPSSSPGRSDAKIGGSQKALDLQNSTCTHSQSEVQPVVKEDSDNFKNDSVFFQELEENLLHISQVAGQLHAGEPLDYLHTHATDTATTSNNTLSVKRSVTTTVGGLARNQTVPGSLRSTKPDNILFSSAVEHTNAVLVHNWTKDNVLGSDVTEDLDINHDNERRRETSSCKDQANSPGFCPSKSGFKSVNKTCNPLCKTNVQDLPGFKTACNMKTHISEKNLRKTHLFKKDESLCFSSDTSIKTVDRNDSLEKRASLDAASAMTFKGFRTASRKEIVVTESNLVAGSLLFKDIDDTVSQNPNNGCKTNMFDLFPKLVNMKPDNDEMTSRTGTNTSKSLDEMLYGEVKEEKQKANVTGSYKQSSLANGQTNYDINDQIKNFSSPTFQSIKTQNCTPVEMNQRNFLGVSTEIQSHFFDILTESQKAEVNELSSILENADSQFDFTQFKKVNMQTLNNGNIQSTKDSISESQKLNSSDVWKDVDFNDSFATERENIENIVTSVKLAFKNNNDTNACNSDNKTEPNTSFKHNAGGFNLASGKSINIADEGLVKAIKLFSDLDNNLPLSNHLPKGSSKTDANCISISESLNVPHVVTDCNAGALTVKGKSHSISPDTIESYPEFKEKDLFQNELSDKDQLRMLNRENPNFMKCNSTEMKNSDLGVTSESSSCSELEAECVPNNIVSNGYGRLASAACFSALPVGFATGKGKLIDINKASLEKARTLFNDILEPSDVCDGHLRTHVVHGSSSSVVKANSIITSPIDGGKTTHKPAIGQPSVGFSIASEKAALVPNDSLHEQGQTNRNMSTKEVNKEAGLPPEGISVSKMSFFSTAGGKPVQLSDESLKRAREMFAEIDDIQVVDQQNPGIVRTGSTVQQNQKEKLNSSSLQDLQKHMQGKTTDVHLPPLGFSTANGKIVPVSQNSLQKARMILADTEGNADVSEGGDMFQSRQAKTGISNQEINKHCGVVLDSLENSQHIQTKISKVIQEHTVPNQIAALPCSEGVSGVPALGNMSDKEVVNETGLSKLNIPKSKMAFFNTAGGKPNQLSDESLKKAQEMFVDIDDRQLAGQEKHGSSVMQSGEGKIKASSLDTSSLQHVQKSDIQVKEPNVNLPPLGFSTASGKTVAVSYDALQKARQMFSDTDSVSEAGPRFQKLNKDCGVLDSLEHKKIIQTSITKVNQTKLALNQLTNDPCSGVMVGGPSFENISNIDVGKERCLPQRESPISKMPFFTTARGNPVKLSDEALKKAKEMFAEIDDGQIADQRSHASVSAASIDKQSGKEKLKSSSVNSSNLEVVQKHTMQVKVPAVDLPTLGFSTASGKTVAVSPESLKKAKLMFANADDATNTESKAQSKTITCTLKQGVEYGSITALGTFQVNKANIDKHILSESNDLGNPSRIKVVENDSMPRMPCFSTAGGKSVTTSEKSLKKAREMFSEIDNVCFSQHDKLEGTLGNNSRVISMKEMSVIEVVLKKSEIKYSPNAGAKNSFGFSTASGKQVPVSESAVQKVKGLFDEFSHVENLQENLDANHDSIKMNMLTPIVNKPEHIADSITKFNSSQNDISNPTEGVRVGQKSARTYDNPMSNIPLPMPGRHSTPFHDPGTRIPKKLKSNLYFTSSQTPENDFEIEAAESAKAFMDDGDLTDAEMRTDGLNLSSDKPPNLRNGKRLRPEDGNPRGEPPIKRQLLPEFDRSLVNESKLILKPLSSSPGSLKDRRRFLYNVSLKPLSCNPTSFSKGKLDVPVSKLGTPSHFTSKAKIFQRTLAAKSTDVSAEHRSPLNNTPSSKTVKSTFVPPFTKKLCIVSDNQRKDPKRQDSDNAKENLHENHIEVGTSNLGNQNNESDFSDLVPNLRCARDMQEMRLRKKQRCKIKPHPGSLYRQKMPSADRISLVSAVEGRRPTVHTKTELYRLGVVKNHIGINSERARTFEFRCMDYLTRECILSGGGVQIADGGWLVPSDQLTAGRLEFFRALCDTPGVDPKLISSEWVYNHYRWIVWKLAAMEVMFPEVFASRCLTPGRVLLQLKYRYDVEIDQSRRSAVRKIMERDDTAAKTLVLCISRIISQGSRETKQESAVIEVTDGWYGIKALLDTALTSLLHRGRLFIGQKIVVHGAELVGSDDACTPLEAPESLMLKIAANSTRPACWYTRLGYFHDPRPFCLRLSSLFAGGGIVGCVDVVIQRIYPIQWMEKMGNGTYAFRNDRAEEREAERHSAKQQKHLEVLFVNIQEQFEQQDACARGKRGSKHHSLSRQKICALQDGGEIYEAIYNEPDPDYLESCLSSEQLRALNHHRQVVNDKKQAQIQAEFRKAIESAEQGAAGCTRRDVTPVWKMRVVDYKDHDNVTAYILNIWRPLPDVVSLLKEGSRFKMYQLAASQSKSKLSPAGVQLTATKKTQFQQLQASQNVLEQIYTERQVTELSWFLKPNFTAAYGEVDVVGLVISTHQKTGAAPMVYLSDGNNNVVAVKFWTDLGQLSLEELTRPCTFIAAGNLHWRSEYMSGIPIVFAGDLSFVVANPKEHHLQKAIQKLRHSVQSVQECCSEAEMKLMNTLQVHHPEDRRSHCAVNPHTPIAAGSRSSTPLLKVRNPPINAVYTPDGSNGDMDVKTCKKMKGLDFLVRIPSPPPLTPVRPIVSPSLQRAFRPPRSLQKEVLIGGKSAHNTGTRTPGKSDSGFVADDELAMIDTQALVAEEKKMNKQQETCRSVSEVSDGDLQKDPPNPSEKVPSPSNSNGHTSAESDQTKGQSHLIHQRKLCRKRRSKM
ncbi:breast cancer type 2 susceptibility protein isoform X2 [Mixophyes fleayi]|uniref:breast cancer type 2 susceptibility protein isoform X2 n=1 Tax=Mixophyes fleayi TaxID=3061075 RepID=UPI003F4E0761